MLTIKLLLLVLVANGAPVIMCQLFRRRWSLPVDGGITLSDGHPLFGASKTWRGILSALLLTGAVAVILNLSFLFGVTFAALAMLGDLMSSFIKRRLGCIASSQALGLDQLPESLLPLLFASWALAYSVWLALLLSLVFMVTDIFVSPWLYRLGLRERPY